MTRLEGRIRALEHELQYRTQKVGRAQRWRCRSHVGRGEGALWESEHGRSSPRAKDQIADAAKGLVQCYSSHVTLGGLFVDPSLPRSNAKVCNCFQLK